jgi:hypothetical protein
MSELRRTLLANRGRATKVVPIEVTSTKERVLWWLNAVACVLHACSFIAALAVSIVFASQSFRTEITSDFRRYDANATGDVGPFSSELRTLSTYPLIWVDLPFPLITAIFHGVIAFSPVVWKYYKESVFEEGGNPLRWIEYSITASLMIWVIMQLSGITNLFILLVVGIFGNIALQWQGYLQERMKGRSWVPTAVGWLIFLGQWIIILAYFFTAITSPRPADVQRVPWFVYSIVIGLFFLFSTFGLIQLAYMAGWPRFMKTAYAQEIAYLVMSFTAKLFLTWNLLIGIAVNPVQ